MRDPDWKVKLHRTLLNVFRRTRTPVPNDFPEEKHRLFAQWMPPGIRTVIDVGAHGGEFARMMRTFLPEATILSFEPQRESYDVLRTAMGSDPQFKAFNVALGDTEGTIELFQNAFTPCSSLLPMTWRCIGAFPFTACTKKTTVAIRRLDAMVDVDALCDDVLLKIDTQGFEDRVIVGGTNVLRRARYVVLEVSFVPLYRGQQLFPAIRNLLESRGFRFVRLIQEMRQSFSNTVVQADALFERVPVAAPLHSHLGGNRLHGV